MDLNAAKDIVLKNNPGCEIVGGLEYDKFYLFSIVPKEKRVEDYCTGSYFPIVYKNSGRYSMHNIFSDSVGFRKAKPIKL